MAAASLAVGPAAADGLGAPSLLPSLAVLPPAGSGAGVVPYGWWAPGMPAPPGGFPVPLPVTVLPGPVPVPVGMSLDAGGSSAPGPLFVDAGLGFPAATLDAAAANV
jgi:hypothetical protein